MFFCSSNKRHGWTSSGKKNHALFIQGGVPPSAYLIVAGSVLLLGTRIYQHRRGRSSNAASFGRPERIVLLVAGIFAPAPFNSLLFITGAILSLVSSIQILMGGPRREKNGP
jgi:hypothetical protein